MPSRPPTALSEISSAISDDGEVSKKSGQTGRQSPAYPPTSATQQGYAHLRGVTQPTNRSFRSAPPSTPSVSSRPESPSNQSTKTHIPSIAAQGFLRPLSSQRLQAQRSRPHRDVRSPTPTSDSARDGEESKSVNSNQHGPFFALSQSHPTAPSFTDYTQSEIDHHDLESQNPPSQADGDTYLVTGLNHSRQKPLRTPQLNMAVSQSNSEHPQQSPLSLRSHFSLGNQNRSGHGHEQLSSASPSIKTSQKKRSIIPRISGPGKNYEYFEGNTIFCWGGRLQNSRDRPINIATGIIIILPVVLFFVYSAPFLWHHVTPAIPIIFAYLFFICFSSFLHASFVDPGVFPRNVHPFPAADADDLLAIGPSTSDWVMVRLATSETAAMDVPVKYCSTCNIWRPPRCYHCRVCDNCVETLDHHCVWLNNCVGRRNYRYFFTFVWAGTLTGLLLAFGSLGHVIAYHNENSISFGSAINQCRVPFAMFIFGLVAGFYPISLCSYHLFLTSNGQTTREYLTSRRFPKNDRHRPFTQGNLFKNWAAVFARPKPPTYLHFKRKYEDGDQRFGQRRGQIQAPLVPEAQNGGLEMRPVPGDPTFHGGPNGSVQQKSEPR